MDNFSTTVENPENTRIIFLRKGEKSAISSISSSQTPRYNFLTMCNDVSMDESDKSEIRIADQVETPVDLRPDLSMYGIDEYDRGICEDSYLNRTALRKNKLAWIPMYAADGSPTNLIQVISPEMQEARITNGIEGRRNILVDAKNVNSDYLSGLDLIYAHGADELVPPWIMNATRNYEEILEKRDEFPDKKVRPGLVSFPGRCRYIKADGVRCMLWHAGRAADDGYCRTHLGSVNSDAGVGAVARARQRIATIAPHAVDVMEEMMMTATSEIVRQRAAEQILDRAGVRGGIEVEHKGEVEIKPAKDMLVERLKVLAANTEKQHEFEADIKRALDSGKPQEDIVDADIVEDEISANVEDTENDNR